MNSNLNILIKEINALKIKDAMLNYYFEPLCKKQNIYWKRHLNFDDLKLDFMKDVTDYGFYQYISQTYLEQKDNKNISNYCKSQYYGFADYLKKIHKSRINDELKEYNKRIRMREEVKHLSNRPLSPNAMGNQYMKNLFEKRLNNNNFNFLSRIYNQINSNEKNKKEEKEKKIKNKLIKKRILTPEKNVKMNFVSNSYSKINNNELDKQNEKYKLNNIMNFSSEYINSNFSNKSKKSKYSMKPKKKNIIFKHKKDINKIITPRRGLNNNKLNKKYRLFELL